MFPVRQKWQSLLAPPKKPEETALAAGKHWKRLVQMKKDVATLRRQSLPAGQQWPPALPADADAEPTARKPAEAAAKAAARRGSLGTHGAHPRDPIVKMAMRSRESISRAAQLQARTAFHLHSACTRMPGDGGGCEHLLIRSFAHFLALPFYLQLNDHVFGHSDEEDRSDSQHDGAGTAVLRLSLLCSYLPVAPVSQSRRAAEAESAQRRPSPTHHV
jgi:hypothetical protein